MGEVFKDGLEHSGSSLEVLPTVLIGDSMVTVQTCSLKGLFKPSKPQGHACQHLVHAVDRKVVARSSALCAYVS